MEEVTKWLSENGVQSVSENALVGHGNPGHKCKSDY